MSGKGKPNRDQEYRWFLATFARRLVMATVRKKRA